MIERFEVGRGPMRHHHGNQNYLLDCMNEIASGKVDWLRRRSLETYVLAILRQKAQRGRLSDLSGSPHLEIQLWAAAITCGIHGAEGVTPLADLTRSDFKAGLIVYCLPHGILQPKAFEAHRAYFEQLLGGPIVISATTPAGAVEVRRVPSLPPVLQLIDASVKWGHITLGVDLISGEPVRVAFADLMHTQIAGVSGFGKSTFLQSFLEQCLDLCGDELEHVYVVDLKGTDFVHLVCNRLDIVFDFAKVCDLVDDVFAEMERRLSEMRSSGLRKWTGGRLLLVIDEFAQIMFQGIDSNAASAAQKKAQAVQQKLVSTLCRLGMLGRAAGITLICATQKPTADAIPTQLRANLDAAVMFRSSRLMASSIFGGDANLMFDPIDLPRGHAIAFLDGEVRYLKSYMS
jgi:hypothetical protein